MILAALLGVATGRIAGETPPADAATEPTPEGLPAEGFELPTDKYVSQIAVSLEGRFLLVELTTASRKQQMHEVRLFNVEKGDSLSLKHMLPEYETLDAKTTGPWLAGVGADGKALVLLPTYPSRVGLNVPRAYRFLDVDLAAKRILHDETFRELGGCAIFCVTRVGTEWWLTVYNDEDKSLVMKAFDIASGNLRTLPFCGGCPGVFSDGDPLLAVHPDRPNARIKNLDLAEVGWFVRSNRDGTHLTPLAPCSDAFGWSHLIRISADAKRLGFCSTTENEDGTKTHRIGVIDISEGKQKPTELWKREIPSDNPGRKYEWPVFLPIGVTNAGTLLLLEPGQKKILAMWPDGSTKTLAERVNYQLMIGRFPRITPERLWYVKQANRKENLPPTLHSVDVEAIDKTDRTTGQPPP
ncbi:MAG: hypothetical protein GVY16_06420 [Planctomycetes bacterium]|jgi:hypothetical protein|nr:hypothetical protein [Planctomycetota bacterium]